MNPKLILGAVFIAGGVFLLVSAGVTVKSLVALAVGGFLALQSVSPELAAKLKAIVLAKLKEWANEAKEKSGADKVNPVEPVVADKGVEIGIQGR
jgi:hypothetical protein